MHAVTGEPTYMVLFAGYFGHQSVAVHNCERLPTVGAAGPFSVVNIARSYRQIEGRGAPAEVEVESLEVPEVWLTADEVVLITNKPQIKHYEFPQYMGQDGVNGDGEDDDDSDWAAQFGDFGDSDESSNSDWDNLLNESFTLDDAKEFNFSACDFRSRYGDSNWQEDATTLLGSRSDFKGP
jgi:hypothetical protein